MSMIDDENNHFPTGSMVVKGEYLTHDNNARKKGGYVYKDYKPGASVYPGMILGANYSPMANFKGYRKKVGEFLY